MLLFIAISQCLPLVAMYEISLKTSNFKKSLSPMGNEIQHANIVGMNNKGLSIIFMHFVPWDLLEFFYNSFLKMMNFWTEKLTIFMCHMLIFGSSTIILGPNFSYNLWNIIRKLFIKYNMDLLNLECREYLIFALKSPIFQRFCKVILWWLQLYLFHS